MSGDAQDEAASRPESHPLRDDVKRPASTLWMSRGAGPLVNWARDAWVSGRSVCYSSHSSIIVAIWMSPGRIQPLLQPLTLECSASSLAPACR